MGEASRGRRGTSIEMARRDGVVMCFLAFDALDKDSDPKLLAGAADLFICLSTRVLLLYCPWCGVEIRKFYRNADLPEYKD